MDVKQMAPLRLSKMLACPPTLRWWTPAARSTPIQTDPYLATLLPHHDAISRSRRLRPADGPYLLSIRQVDLDNDRFLR